MKPVGKWGLLKKLYGSIPPMKCKPGCTECCGPVPWTDLERSKLTNPQPTTSINCPYIGEGIEGSFCTVYENRPFMCRLFGATEAMKCPHGCKPDVLLTDVEACKLTDQYVKLNATVPV